MAYLLAVPSPHERSATANQQTTDSLPSTKLFDNFLALPRHATSPFRVVRVFRGLPQPTIASRKKTPPLTSQKGREKTPYIFGIFGMFTHHDSEQDTSHQHCAQPTKNPGG